MYKRSQQGSEIAIFVEKTYLFVVLLWVFPFYANIIISKIFLLIVFIAYFQDLLLEIYHVLEGFERQELPFLFRLERYLYSICCTSKGITEFRMCS